MGTLVCCQKNMIEHQWGSDGDGSCGNSKELVVLRCVEPIILLMCVSLVYKLQHTWSSSVLIKDFSAMLFLSYYSSR